jgi:hypothetical protein
MPEPLKSDQDFILADEVLEIEHEERNSNVSKTNLKLIFQPSLKMRLSLNFSQGGQIE